MDRKPKKVLVILLSEMGSLVLASPMFQSIREAYPRCSIYALLFERNREFFQVLNMVPRENMLALNSDSLMRLFLDSVRALLKIRRIGIDTVLDCELFSRISSLFSFLSGARIRVGFHPYTQEGLFRGHFINRPVLYNPYHHISKQFLNLVAAIESNQVPMVKRLYPDEGRFELPRLDISRKDLEEMSSRLKDDFPQVFGKRLVLIYPGGGLLPIRAWPLENFCRVTRGLVQKGYAVGIIGLDNDKALAEKILDYCRNTGCIDLTGYTRSVRELLILFHLASLLITNDGGPGHFASLTPVPTIVFYGPETPALYGTLDQKTIQFYAPLSCSPCLTAYNHRNSPCDGDNLCLKSIDPKDVLDKAIELLDG